MEKFATVSWTPQDIVDCPHIQVNGGMTLAQAEEFLERNSNQIQSDMVERGWASIETLFDYERHDAE